MSTLVRVPKRLLVLRIYHSAIIDTHTAKDFSIEKHLRNIKFNTALVKFNIKAMWKPNKT